MLNPSTWSWVEKAGVVSLLAGNIVALATLIRFVFKSLQDKLWVPGWAYNDIIVERNRLRAENDAYRDVTLRAIKITTTVIGTEGK